MDITTHTRSLLPAKLGSITVVMKTPKNNIRWSTHITNLSHRVSLHDEVGTPGALIGKLVSISFLLILQIHPKVKLIFVFFQHFTDYEKS
jgi:hypothetical protein